MISQRLTRGLNSQEDPDFNPSLFVDISGNKKNNKNQLLLFVVV